jgi:hypothetical protein
VTTQFANLDDFLDRVEAELGLDNDDDQSLDGSLDGTPRPKTSFEVSANAKASLASALDNPDMDLAANSHASAKSWRTNFSSSTGNSTNRSINTRQFTIAHKSCALELAMEKKCAAQLEFENKDMACQLQELELLFATYNTGSIPPKGPPAPPALRSICIAATGPSHSSIDNSDNSSSAGDPDVQVIIPHIEKKKPSQPTHRVPSKKRLHVPKSGAQGGHPLDGDY